MPATLMSICRRSDAVARSGNLEVHVAVVIFGARDVGQDRRISRLPSPSPIATPATGAFSGTPASISESDAPQTVAIEDDPFDSRMSETTRIA